MIVPFFTQLLIKMTKTLHYFLPLKWNPVVSLAQKHTNQLETKVGKCSNAQKSGPCPSPLGKVQFIFLIIN